MKTNKLSIPEMANILANEASLLHCSFEYAWDGMSKDITNQFKYEDVEAYILEKIEQGKCNM